MRPMIQYEPTKRPSQASFDLISAFEVIREWDRQDRMMIRRWNAGVSLAQIAKELDRSTRSIRRSIEAWIANEGNPRNLG
jgi:hypothetical protein